MTDKETLTQLVHDQARARVAKFMAGRRDWQDLQHLRCELEPLAALCRLLGLTPVSEVWGSDDRRARSPEAG